MTTINWRLETWAGETPHICLNARPFGRAFKRSLSKNYTNAPVSVRIEVGAMTWKNGEKMRGRMQSSQT